MDTVMLLQHKETQAIVEIVDVLTLIDPSQKDITVRSQQGEEEQDPEPVHKQDLMFPSGEALPQCWMDENYQIK
jgi:hypothetical protein